MLGLSSPRPTMGEQQSIAGRVLAEKYLLIERLGEGGFGSIWRAEHQVLKSPVAVKLIDLEVARREGAVERFLREAQATAALRSPHVVQILDYGLDHRDEGGTICEQPFIVMELLEGENLAERIARIGALSPLDVVRVVTHVARAMSRAHELGIVHRDLKPENIFLVSNGDEEIAKVLDFGVAKIASPMDLRGETYTQTGSLVGTPYYMSPEQAQGNKTVDHRSDLWALGVIAFEMLTGKRPFDSDALGDFGALYLRS
ncbi:MAG: serine/threonine-protein kinase [Polyangiaceae bacterium]